MSAEFWAMLGVVAPVFIVQIFQYLTTVRNAKKSADGREEIKAQVAEVRDHVETIKTSKAETQLLIAGAERQNIAQGIEIGKSQASGLAPLGDAENTGKGT